MTQDEIIEMAKLAGWEMDNSCVLSPQILWYIYQEQLETFAKLVAQHERERIKAANAPEIERINAHIKKLEDAVLSEREACAKVCEEYADDSRTGDTCAEEIRARGQA